MAGFREQSAHSLALVIMYDISTNEDERMTGRLLDLLDQAYEAAENPEAVDGFLSSADRFFFPKSANQGVAEDIDEAQALTSVLDRHMNRIQTLVTQKELGVTASNRIGLGPQLANLVLSSDGLRVLGNTAAVSFFGRTFPCSLADLGISNVSKKEIRACLSDICEGSLEGSRVVKLERLDDTKPYLARCTKIQSRGADGKERQGLTITVNHIDWQTEATAHAASIFDLTRAEQDLLACMLEGQSYQDAAEALSKSRETVRAQAKSILRKTNTTQMSEVVQFMMGYAFLAEAKSGGGGLVAPPVKPITEDQTVICLPNNRKVQINRFGKVGGRPLYFWHGLYQGPYFTPTLDRLFKEAGFDVIAPSRPGFNRTHVPDDWTAFNQTTTEDAVAVCEYFGLSQLDFVVHHAGISFACRAAKALKGRVGSAVMIGAGVPIRDEMLKTMNTEARVAGAAARYAPKVLEMILRVGIAKWRRQGAYSYFSNLFSPYPADLATLNDPETGPVMERGIHHMISNGPKTIMRDGASAMSNWEPEYKHLPDRQLWLHGAHDPVMNVQFVQEFLEAKGMRPPVIYPERGGDVLLAEAQDVVARISGFLNQGDAGGRQDSPPN